MTGDQTENRGSFSGRLGFVMAAAGSAIGLGNLWRFPYLASHYGGGIFVLIYVILAVTFGFSLMLTEVTIGRKTGKSCIVAFGELSQKYKWIGYIAAATPILFMACYCVIGGWVLKWFAECVTGHLSVLTSDGGNYWHDYITGSVSGLGEPAFWFVLFTAISLACVAIGVNKGIEKLSKILMPALFIMVIIITIYELTIPGIWDGIVYYLNPDPAKLSISTFMGATSQIFYSMSLGIGVMITYGSYMRKDVSIEGSVRNISLMDTAIAILAGMMIVPPAFLYGFSDSQGMGLMFTALPQVFQSMPAGQFVAPVFYLLVFFAAITSCVSIIETLVSVFIDGAKFRRKVSIAITATMAIILGAVIVLGFGPLMTDLSPFDQGAGWLGIFDSLTNSFLIPIVSILTCLLIGYVVKVSFINEEVESEGNEFKFKKPYEYLVKYICPIFLLAIMIFGTLDMIGIFSIY